MWAEFKTNWHVPYVASILFFQYDFKDNTINSNFCFYFLSRSPPTFISLKRSKQICSAPNVCRYSSSYSSHTVLTPPKANLSTKHLSHKTRPVLLSSTLFVQIATVGKISQHRKKEKHKITISSKSALTILNYVRPEIKHLPLSKRKCRVKTKAISLRSCG